MLLNQLLRLVTSNFSLLWDYQVSLGEPYSRAMVWDVDVVVLALDKRDSIPSSIIIVRIIPRREFISAEIGYHFVLSRGCQVSTSWACFY